MKKLLYILLFVPIALFGQDNYSLSFDGVDDFVDIGIPNGMNPTGSHTFLLFSKNQTQPCNSGVIISEHLGMNLSANNNLIHYGYRGCESNCLEGNCMAMDFYANSVYSTSQFSSNWDYWAFVYNAVTLERKIYLNGALLADDIASGAYQGTFDLILGAIDYVVDSGMGDYFNGFIDDVSLWSHPLSIDEIQSYMNCPPTGNEEGLVGYWNFNEGSGDTVYDISGNGNHGEINGATYSEDIPENNCIEGCTDSLAVNFNSAAMLNDGSCISQEEFTIDSLQQANINLNNTIEEATISISSLQQAIDTWNTTIDLSAGWNIIGYGCPGPINVADGLSNHTESIIITKDNNGNVYMPEFGFNGIGDFTPGYGYQIKLTEAIESFSLCDWYVNDIPEDNIVSLQDSIDILNSEILDLECVNQGACSFNIALNECEYAEEGFDCNGNIDIQVGDEAFGGIVFYLDETGEHGLVAAMEDLTEGATDAFNVGNIGYEWGCNNQVVNGADGTALGTGYLNTMDIVNQGCSTIEGITAAQAALDAEINGYSDWYLPSRDELLEMYNTIGHGGPEGNIGGFKTTYHYWSSSQHPEYSEVIAWGVSFYTGCSDENYKDQAKNVRVIRSF